MNVTSINFKGITKIIGNRPIASADRISDIIRHSEKSETKAERILAMRYPSEETQDLAISLSFNQGKTAYVVTGKEYKQLSELYDDVASNIEIAINHYGHGSEMVKLVLESEMNRYADLSKMIVMNQEDSTLRVDYDDSSNKITSLDLIL